jgi:glutamate/tyrosine decarboxylase-like PLP-dependent enzyme
LITSGGSMANLIALTAARDRFLGGAARSEGLQGRTSSLTVYTSEEVHSSTDKAISILGIGTKWLRHLACDGQFRIRLDLLAKAVAEDRANGLSPFCVVASAGTVTTGAIDPIRELAAFCKAEGLWLHVDGAYGALAALSERFRPALAAVGEADSVSLDPHKFLFTSFEAGCVLVKDTATLRHAFNFSPSYLTMSRTRISSTSRTTVRSCRGVSRRSRSGGRCATMAGAPTPASSNGWRISPPSWATSLAVATSSSCSPRSSSTASVFAWPGSTTPGTAPC